MRTGSVPYFLCRARLYQRLKNTTDIQNKYLVVYHKIPSHNPIRYQ